MDKEILFETFRALGIGVAAGAVLGLLPRSRPQYVTIVLCGLLTGYLVYEVAGQPGWPVLAVIAGTLGCSLAYAASSAVFTATRARLEDASPAGLMLFAAVAGLVIAGLTVLLPPFAIAATLGALWLLIASERRARRKYAGLRILR